MYFIGCLRQVDIRHPVDRYIRLFHHRSEQHRTGGESFQGVSGRIREPLPQRKKAAPPESKEKLDWDNIYNNESPLKSTIFQFHPLSEISVGR